MSFYNGLLFFSLLTAVYPIAFICYMPFIEINKYNTWRMSKYVLPVCIIVVGIGYILNYFFYFEQNANTALYVSLPFMLLYYRWVIAKFVAVDLYKLLFVFFLALHVSSALTVVRMPVNLFAQAVTENTEQANILIEYCMILSRIVYYPIITWLIWRYIKPRLNKIESSNIKWLWIIPASFTFISLSIYSYHVSQSTSYFILVINVPLNILSFLIYIVILNMLDNVMESTRLKTESAALERTNMMKSELLSTISHEARTPLAVLASYAGLVSMELKGKGMETQTAANLDKVVFEAKRVAELIDSMNKLTLSGKNTPERIRVDIADIIRQTAELYRHLLESDGTKLELHIEKDLPAVFGSPEELTQVMFNLLQNSRKASADCVVVNAQCSIHNVQYVEVSVADTGTGIPIELLPRVFERGVSGNNGTGLGLAICREIVESHNGSIGITSEIGVLQNCKAGTKVWFTIPVINK